MIKKAISFSIIIFVIFLIYQYGVNIFKKEHSIIYTIGGKETYKIYESYSNDHNRSYYLFKVITEDKKEFVFESDNLFNKQKEVISKIEKFDQDGWTCLSLIYKNKKGSSNPLCMNNNQLYSYNYAKNFVDLTAYVAKLPGFDLNKEQDADTRVDNEQEHLIVTTNKGYFDDNEVLLLYNYKRVAVFYKDYDKVINFANQDTYKNTLGTVVGKYYLVPRYEISNPEIRTYVKYNISSGIKTEIVLQNNLSKEFSYINGVYNDKLYVFDRNNMTQYEINPYTDEVTITGDMEKYPFAYINGEETKVSIFEMSNEEVKFSNKIDQYKDLGYENIFENGIYAIYNVGENYYKVYAKYSKNPILLFSEPEAKEVKESHGNVYFIKEDSIYKYNDYGIFELIKSNELIYNSENIYDVFYE